MTEIQENGALLIATTVVLTWFCLSIYLLTEGRLKVGLAVLLTPPIILGLVMLSGVLG